MATETAVRIERIENANRGRDRRLSRIERLLVGRSRIGGGGGGGGSTPTLPKAVFVKWIPPDA